MRWPAMWIGAACLAACSGCTPQPPQLDSAGVLHYGTSHTSEKLACAVHPIQLDGDHTDITLTGSCTFVRLAGSHNDVAVNVAPGGTIDITGSSNDVYWYQVAAGPSPNLLNQGKDNAFHKSEHPE